MVQKLKEHNNMKTELCHFSALEALCTPAALEAAAARGPERAGYYLYQDLLPLEHAASVLVSEGGAGYEEAVEKLLLKVSAIFGGTIEGLGLNYDPDGSEEALGIRPDAPMPSGLARCHWSGAGILAPRF